MGEKLEFGRWWIWVLILLIFSGIILTGLNYAGIIGKTYVERKVFEQSYQKKEADKEAHSTYDAQLSILRSRLNNPNLTDAKRQEIQAQIDSIIILKSTKEN